MKIVGRVAGITLRNNDGRCQSRETNARVENRIGLDLVALPRHASPSQPQIVALTDNGCESKRGSVIHGPYFGGCQGVVVEVNLVNGALESGDVVKRVHADRQKRVGEVNGAGEGP